MGTDLFGCVRFGETRHYSKLLEPCVSSVASLGHESRREQEVEGKYLP